LASSAQIEGEPAIARRAQAPGTEAHYRLTDLPVGDGAAYLVVSLGVRTAGGDYQVVVAQSLAAAQSSVRTVSALLLVGLPILALLVGAVTFALVGRSLRPVESMRRRVSAISARDLSMRVPVPPAQDELSRLAQTMNDMLDRLERSQAAARRFVADASHELRSPVSALKATLHVTGSEAAGSDWPESRAAMAAEADRLERIVADLLFLAAADDRGLRPVADDVDLDDLVDAERQRLRTATSLHIGGRVQAVRCTGDRHQLSQALRNLADNAAAHARHRVDISLSQQGDSAVIEVSDDGPGVPEGDRTKIFDRFVRLDASRTRVSGGTGLGLAIVAEVVRAYGGTVRVYDGPLGGAAFRLELPLGGGR
jgi:signal transduction histidine kinase